MWGRCVFTGGILLILTSAALGRVAFEKLTGYDFQGTTYYTIQNLSLWECQGWCREEPECAAASFSFVMNPLAPAQDTLCLLQNETKGANPDIQPSRAMSMYYTIKLTVRSENVCNRPWQFERVPNKRIRGLDNVKFFAPSKEDCISKCLNEDKFVCRSAEYNYTSLYCHLSEYDRRTADDGLGLIDAQGIDYFENLCVKADKACKTERSFEEPTFSVSKNQVAQYVGMHYYVDKELMANSAAACEKACEMDDEFLCRSFLYKGDPTPDRYNCHLFHLDHYTLPDGAKTFESTDRPLLDDGSRIGTYYENTCKVGASITGSGGSGSGSGTSGSGSGASGSGSGASGSGSGASGSGNSGSGGGTFTTHSPDTDVGSAGGDSGNVNCDTTGVCYDVSVHCKDTRIAVEVITNRPFNGRIYALGRSETCNIAVINSDKFRLDLTMGGQDCNTQSANGVYTNTVVIQHHSVVMTKTDKIYKVRCTYDMSPKNITFGMMPIRDPDMIPITSAPEAPPPRIRILDAALREVETVRIGDRLTFQIEIPESTPYGIFARSCVAMAKDSRSTFQIIDDEGCPVDPEIFPQFEQDGSALQAKYDAFRFTESYGVIFQCNVKYCLGPCQPADCKHGRDRVQSWGRKRRSLGNGHAKETTKKAALMAAKSRGHENSEAATIVYDNNGKEEMSISQEILVLDLGDEIASYYKSESSSINETDPYYTDATYHQYDTTKINLFETCPTRSSVLALAVTCAILLLIYVLTVFYFVMKKWMKPVKNLR